MGERARFRLIRASQSDELRETFRQLSEIDGPNGPKYPRRVLLELAARIAGRAYEPMLLELCHLTRAALLAGRGPPGARRAGRPGNAGAGFEWLFWGVEEARAGAFRTAFFHAPAGSAAAGRAVPASPAHEDAGPPEPGGTLRIGDEAIILAYAGGSFEIRYGRMVDLAAMMELLVSTLGYRTLAAALDPLAAPALDRGGVSDAARDLARRFYRWLGDHLPAAQAQRKFHAMVSFLEETAGSDFTEEDIDDDTILRFWLRHAVGGAESTPGEGDPSGESAAPGTGGHAVAGRRRAGPTNGGGIIRTGSAPGTATDFRGYRNTFLAFLALARVLSTGAAIGRFEQRTAIGSDFDGGEIDPAADSAMPEGAPGDEDDPLAPLQEEPAVAIKALNRGELALLRLPVGESEGVRRLPRSYLRAECFGPVQNRLSQALRRRAGAAELAAVIASGPDPGYRARILTLEKAEAHLQRVALACLYVLHRIAGTVGGSEGRDGDGSDRGDGDEDEAGSGPEIDFRLLGEARRAFEGLNRTGFERSAPRDPRLAPAYRAVADQFPTITDRLRAVLRTLGPPAAWQAAEAEDRPIFSRALTGSTVRGRTKRHRFRKARLASKERRTGSGGNDHPCRPAATRRERPEEARSGEREETDEQGVEREGRGGTTGAGGGLRRPARRRAAPRRRRGAAARRRSSRAAGTTQGPVLPPVRVAARQRTTTCRDQRGALRQS